MKLRSAIWTCSVLVSLGAALLAPAQSPSPVQEEKAIFAGGCFWCMQAVFDPAVGLIATRVGYTGGSETNPTYGQVSAGETGHREAIEVTFDPAKVSYAQLLTLFWMNINPVQRDGQFHDFGEQYTSAIYYGNEEQRRAAEFSRDVLARSGRFQKPIVTEIQPATQFWPAEEYHQKYYLKNKMAYRMYHFTSGRASFKQRFWGSEHGKIDP